MTFRIAHEYDGSHRYTMASGSFLGRSTAGEGAVEEIPFTGAGSLFVLKAGDTMTGHLRVPTFSVNAAYTSPFKVYVVGDDTWDAVVVVDAKGASFRARNLGSPRYRSDWYVDSSGTVNFNAYDDTGAVFKPIHFTTTGFRVWTTGGIEVADGSTGSYGRFITWDAGGGLRPTSISVSNDGSAAQEIVRLSSSGAHWMKFNATQNASSDANALDDYEEGTWVPGISTANVSINTQYGAPYVKVGRMVTAYVYFILNNNTGGAITQFTITGLPFSSNSYGPGHVHHAGAGWNANTYIEASNTYAIVTISGGSWPTGTFGVMVAFNYVANA